MLLVPPANISARCRHGSTHTPRLCRKLQVSVHASRGGGHGSSRRRDVDDEVGWWEKPDPFEEKNPLDSLTPWQTRRLEQAYAAGRRKVQVSALAKEIDVDRSIVTEWFKRFSKLPESEQNSIVAERQRELEWEDTKAQARAAAAAERPQREALGPKPEEPEPSGTGFIPFQIRKSMPKEKKIRQDVLRTLEMVYERSSYPSDDVIRSLWDLHKIPRSMAIDWFSSKRKEAQASTSEASTSEASDTRPLRAASKQKADQPEKLDKPDRKGAKGAKQREARDGAAAAASAAAAAAAAAISNSRTAAADATPSVPSASADTVDAATPGSEASGDMKREVKRKKGRFDDVKIVVAEDVGPASESQVQGPPQQEGQSMENLVMAYGDLLVKVAKKEDISDLVGSDMPETWAQAWRWHQYKKAMLEGPPRRLNWTAWLDKLEAARLDEVDEELRALDLY